MPSITTIAEMEKYLRENYTFNNTIHYFKYCCENGRFNLYYVERGSNSLRNSFATCEELMQEMIRIQLCHPKARSTVQTAETLEQLDSLLQERNEGYLRPFPIRYKLDCGRYFMYYEDETFPRSNFAMSFKTCGELTQNILKTLSEIPIARTMNLPEILEAKRELDYYKVNYKHSRYYDRRQCRNVHTLFTWRRETEKIKDFNWFSDMYYH